MHIHVNKCINTYKWIIFLNVVISYMFAVKCIFSLQICKFVNNIWGGDIWWVLTFFPINLIWKYLVLWLSIAKWRLTLTLSALEHQSFCLTSVQSLSRVQLFATPVLQHTGPPCPLPTPRLYSNSCPLSQWCHPAISSSVIPFSSCLQSFPASESFPVSQFFPSCGQRIGVSASASVLPMNIQDWFPLGWTGWISLQSKGLSRIFSNTTVQKHDIWQN